MLARGFLPLDARWTAFFRTSTVHTHFFAKIARCGNQVIDGEGNVTGLLNIAKCLYDAIHRLKKKASRAGDGEGGDTNLAASVLQVRTLFSPLLHGGAEKMSVHVAYMPSSSSYDVYAKLTQRRGADHHRAGP